MKNVAGAMRATGWETVAVWCCGDDGGGGDGGDDDCCCCACWGCFKG